MSQFANARLVELGPDEDESSRHGGGVVQRQHQQFGLVPHLLEGVHLRGRIGEADKALGPKDGGGQRAEETLENAALDRFV